jgi:hypothetical protein
LIAGILLKLDSGFAGCFGKVSPSIKDVYDDANTWKISLLQECPSLYSVISNFKCHGRDYKNLYYHYTENIKYFKELMISTNHGILTFKNAQRIYRYPKIISKLWLYLAYSYAYEMLVSIAGDKVIDYNQYDNKEITIDKSWHNILKSIRWMERSSRYGTLKAYLKHGDTSVISVLNPNENNLYAITWMMAVDNNIKASTDLNIIKKLLSLGIKLKDFKGILRFLNKISEDHIEKLCNHFGISVNKNFLIGHVKSIIN